MNDQQKVLELYDRLAVMEAQTLPGYLNSIVVDSRPPRRLKKIIEPWQQTLYDLLVPMFESAAGHRTTDKSAAFITAPKGSSKTSTVAQLLAWALSFSKRPLTMIAAAADRDQAAILLERIRAETAHNPWINLQFKNYKVVGPTGQLEVLASDAPTASGYLPDLIILDEITFWKKRDLADMLLAGRNKRRDCVLVVLSNAGVQGTWQWDLWQQARESQRWITHEVPAFSASWLNREAIEEDKKMLLPALYARLYENRWVDPGQDSGFLTREQLLACVDHTLTEQTRGSDFQYVASLDAGIVSDRTVACLMHMDKDQVFLDKFEVWQPSKQKRMPIEKIEEWLLGCMANFNVRKLVLDTVHLEQLAQKFERRLDVERFSFRGDAHYRLAENVRSLVLNRRLHIYPGAGYLEKPDGSHDDLVTEISNLVVKERDGLYRLDHRPGYHDDMYCALALASLEVVKYRSLPKFHFNDPPASISAEPRKQNLVDVAAISAEQLKKPMEW